MMCQLAQYLGINMTAYVLSDHLGIPADRNMYDLWEGLQQLGEKVVLYEEDAVLKNKLRFTRDDMVCGWVRTVRKALRNIGVKPPKEMDYPKSLKQWLYRPIVVKTLGEVRKIVEDNQFIDGWSGIFIKPHFNHKLFTGLVIKKSSQLNFLKEFKDTLKLYTCLALDILSEWRVYVHHGDIVDIIRYNGSYDSNMPAIPIIKDMINAYKNPPISYSLDVGVMDFLKNCAKDQEYDNFVRGYFDEFPKRYIAGHVTFLMECNDCFALGNYGLRSRKYAELTRDRWYQMVKA
jgi:hypothetical protein